MCVNTGKVEKLNHFMAISIGAEKCTFYDPSEGELATKTLNFWNLLWTILNESEVKRYFPNNITAIKGTTEDQRQREHLGYKLPAGPARG